MEPPLAVLAEEFEQVLSLGYDRHFALVCVAVQRRTADTAAD